MFRRGGKRDQNYSYNPDYNLHYNTANRNPNYSNSYYNDTPIYHHQIYQCQPSCGSLDNIHVHTRTQLKITTCQDDEGKKERKSKRGSGFCGRRKNRRSNSHRQSGFVY